MEFLQVLHKTMSNGIGLNFNYPISHGVRIVLNSQPPSAKIAIRQLVKISLPKDLPEEYFFHGSSPCFVVLIIYNNGVWDYISTPPNFNRKKNAGLMLQLLQEAVTKLATVKAA